MFDNDADSVEDFESSMKISINKAVSYLWNNYDWCFKKKEKTYKTQIGKAYYKLPNGKLLKKYSSGEKTYGVLCENNYLEYVKNPRTLDNNETGTPTSFYIKNDLLYLYPKPDKGYQLLVEYDLIPFGLNKDDEEIFELKEDDDRINIYEKYETLFKNCVISLAMIYAIADKSDENHSGYQQQYDDALAILLKFCEGDGGLTDKTIGW